VHSRPAMEEQPDAVSIARRAVVSRRLFFSHRIARPLLFLALLEIFFTLIFAVLPDTRTGDSDQELGIYVMQSVLAWVNVVISVGCLALIFSTYSVTQRELTFERQSRVGYLIVLKMLQLLLDIALTAYPTFIRNLAAVLLVGINLLQIAYGLYVVRQAREAFTRRIRPPLVIKALLDMKGEALGATKAQPLTLGMLERLEGIVKVGIYGESRNQPGSPPAARRLPHAGCRCSLPHTSACHLTPPPTLPPVCVCVCLRVCLMRLDPIALSRPRPRPRARARARSSCTLLSLHAQVRDQQKFNVHQGREYLIFGVAALLVASFGQFM
jgi:hypothetical protein